MESPERGRQKAHSPIPDFPITAYNDYRASANYLLKRNPFILIPKALREKLRFETLLT